MFPKKSRRLAIVYLWSILFLGFSSVYAQKITEHDFKRAEQFLPQNVDSLVFRANVNPHWAQDTSLFWYSVDTHKGEEFFVVDARKQTKQPFFNQKELARNLSSIINEEINPYKLPINTITWNYDDNSIQFKVAEEEVKWEADLQTLEINKVKVQKDNSSRLSSESPDGKWTVTRKKYNLWLKNNQTGRKYQLTKDGEKNQVYGASLPWASTRKILPKPAKESEPLPLNVVWSENSKKLY